MNFKLNDENSFWKGNFFQVLLLSFSFMFVFTAFQTTGIIEETVLQSIRNESIYCSRKPNRTLPSNVSTNHSDHDALDSNATATGIDPRISPESATPPAAPNVNATDCPEEDKVFGFTGNGYTSLSILYAVFAIASWLAPSLVAIFHSKWSMVISAGIYVLFIASFLIPTTWLLYFLSALLGAGAAVIWTAQGHFLSLISNQKTITRDSGIFWAINQCSFFFGNLLVYWQFQGKSIIDKGTREIIFIPLTVIGVVGVVCFSFLKNITVNQSPEESPEGIEIKSDKPASATEPVKEDSNQNIEKGSQPPAAAAPAIASSDDLETNFSKAFTALKDSMKLFITPNMLLLSLSSIYTGLEFSFLSGVYSTSVGNTRALGENAKTYVGLVGILLGIGEVVGGSLFGLLGTRTTKKGRTPIVFLGAIVHVSCFILVYLNIPNDASVRETMDVSHFSTPSPAIAFLCAFFLGFGDACFQTQLISTFASVYKGSSAPAFAIFKFTQSAASAAAFYSSSYLGIVIQVVVLLVSCLISLVTFGIVEWKTRQLQEKRAKDSADEREANKGGGKDNEGYAEDDGGATPSNLQGMQVEKL